MKRGQVLTVEALDTEGVIEFLDHHAHVRAAIEGRTLRVYVQVSNVNESGEPDSTFRCADLEVPLSETSA